MRPGNSRCCSPAPASRISAPSRSSWLLPTPGDLAPPLVKLSSSHALASGVGPEPIFLSVTEGLEIRAINFSIPMAHVLSPSNKRHRDSPAPSLWHPLLSVFQPRICADFLMPPPLHRQTLLGVGMAGGARYGTGMEPDPVSGTPFIDVWSIPTR